jgi:acyl-CoA thioester hydrolase
MTQAALELRLPILWGDMDALGHVNNTVYFRYMEQARVEWFEGLVDREVAWRSLGMVIAGTSCDFKRALVYPGTAIVRMFLEAPGGASLATRYEILREGDEAPSALGRAVIVFVNPATGKPVRIPQWLRERLPC